MRTCAARGHANAVGALLQRLRRALRAASGREVRKVVTVVFSDVVGSTTLGEKLESEAVRGVLSRYLEAMQATLERDGSTVENIGDAVMAVFGVPSVHEDDARRAAAAMRDELAASTTISSTGTASVSRSEEGQTRVR